VNTFPITTTNDKEQAMKTFTVSLPDGQEISKNSKNQIFTFCTIGVTTPAKQRDDFLRMAATHRSQARIFAASNTLRRLEWIFESNEAAARCVAFAAKAIKDNNTGYELISWHTTQALAIKKAKRVNAAETFSFTLFMEVAE